MLRPIAGPKASVTLITGQLDVAGMLVFDVAKEHSGRSFYVVPV